MKHTLTVIKGLLLVTAISLIYWFLIGRKIDSSGKWLIIGLFYFIYFCYLLMKYIKSPTLQKWETPPIPPQKDRHLKYLFIPAAILLSLYWIFAFFSWKIMSSVSLVLAILLIDIYVAMILYNFYFKKIPFIPLLWKTDNQMDDSFLNKPMQYIFVFFLTFAFLTLNFILIATFLSS